MQCAWYDSDLFEKTAHNFIFKEKNQEISVEYVDNYKLKNFSLIL